MKMPFVLGLLALIVNTTFAIESPVEPAEPPAPTEVVETPVDADEPDPVPASESTVDPAVKLVLDALREEREEDRKVIAQLQAELAELRKEKEEEPAVREIPKAAPKETILLEERERELKPIENADEYEQQEPFGDDGHLKLKITEYVLGPAVQVQTMDGKETRRSVLTPTPKGLRPVMVKGKAPEMPGMTLEPITVLTKRGWEPYWFLAE